MRFRQVHLDFHTSGMIPGIGKGFSKEQFQKALILGHVDSITVFSKCHHGWAYHPSKANRIHPNLDFDLLGEMLEACREINVNAPVYISAGFDEKEVFDHPEWLNVSPDGQEKGTFTKAHYHLMCYNTGYLDVLEKQVEEVMKRYNPVGIFLDISNVRRCVCASCVKSMHQMGLNPDDDADILKHGEMVYKKYAERMEKAVRKYSSTATIFHNAGHIAHGRRDLAGYNTHLELESLPTGGWGYDHFPMSAAYARTVGMDFLGMTGKFHTTWGEFGGFKHPNALIYETGLSLACGAKISIGDQMHPSGEMNESTYRLIGKAYEQVEKKEKWLTDAKNVSDIAVLSCEAVLGGGRNSFGKDSNTGADRMLLEGKYLFDFVDEEADFTEYKLVILPDQILLCEGLTKKLTEYINAGGKVLLTGFSGLNMDRNGFMLDIGAEFDGINPVRPDYMVPDFDAVNGKTAYVMYAPGIKLKNAKGEVFAYRQDSYFNRTWEHFSSHQHTPNDVDSPLAPAAVINGSIAYIAWNVFEDYAVKGELIAREAVVYAIEKLMGNGKSAKTGNLPDRGVLTLQKTKEGQIVHLLYAHTTVRGKGIEVIEDAVPVRDVKVSIKAEKKPESVCLLPDEAEIPFEWKDGCAEFTVPEVLLHQMVLVK
ncbi:MAG: beta-galactosidase trimerization domain-containing protein [Clostridia bacterium]|nr:beta-galactosidase trimerization domain-containing protein [Clostridia bacterium]